MTTLIAITGGIGSGKSTFSKEVVKRGFKLIDSDKQVDKIYKKPSKEFLRFLKKNHLKEAVKNNKINKKKVSEIIFSNKKIKYSLEKYIHRIVRKERFDFIKKQKTKKTKAVFFDIPLLFEKKLNKDFNFIVCVLSNKETRYKRLKKSKKMDRKFFDKILKAQTSDIIRRKLSDIIIYNNTNLEEYKKKINLIIDKVTT
tara:strand:+ start:165 stop:761 length:597 start_codon:yes stop_codon:yes gene_type:complete